MLGGAAVTHDFSGQEARQPFLKQQRASHAGGEQDTGANHSHNNHFSVSDLKATTPTVLATSDPLVKILVVSSRLHHKMHTYLSVQSETIRAFMSWALSSVFPVKATASVEAASRRNYLLRVSYTISSGVGDLSLMRNPITSPAPQGSP